MADTGIVPAPDRRVYLDWFCAELDHPTPSRIRDMTAALPGPAPNPAERELLTRLPECLAAFSALASSDRDRLRQLLRTLIEGMRMDLETVGAEDGRQAGRPARIIALETREELDRYTYFAAGCVGVYWTDMIMAHRSCLRTWDPAAMRQRGLRFGQALQMTNVLRDLAHDLRAGRCYLPRRDLLAHGLQPEDLLDARALARVRPLLRSLVQLTLAHYAEAWAYLAAIPVREVRLRLACAWPLFIGLATLDLVQRAPALLDPQVTVKISRSDLQWILARSAALVWSNWGLRWYYHSLVSRIHAIGGLLDDSPDPGEAARGKALGG
jgi:farnesyl-diphosphate farnesyltransferase